MLIRKLFFIVALLYVAAGISRAETLVQRVEPLFWWTDMEEQELQLMLYGPSIADASISMKYPGVKIIRRELTENPNYVFLYVSVSRKARPGVMPIRIVRAKTTEVYPFELKARAPGSAMRESFSNADAVYLIMPDRFANGDPTNDAIPGYHQQADRSDLAYRHGGDIEGIIQHLPYMADLGITALWTTPMFDNNDVRYSYHHYGCSDYYKVDPRLGTNEDLPRLNRVAAENGIKVILDVVPNHCSSAHWWLSDMPSSNWFNQWDRYTSSNYRMMAWTDPHRSEIDLHRLTHGWFAPNMPDFNLQNHLVFDYLKQVYIFWLEYAGFSGIRVDTYPYNDLQTAARFIQSLRKEYPLMQVVGECWMNTTQEIAYYQSGNNNKDGFDSRLQSVMDFPLGNIFMKAFTEKEGWNEGLARFYMHFALDFAYANPHLLMNFLDNHDIDRYNLVVDGDIQIYKMALAMLTTVRGYPQIYYGGEIMHAGTRGSYEGSRFGFPGGWAGDERNAFVPEGRTVAENEVFNYLRKLLHYRKNNPVLHDGEMKQFVPENGTYVYFRYKGNQRVMVIVNNNDSPASVATARFAEILKDAAVARDIITAEMVFVEQEVMVLAKSVRILEIQ